MSELHEQVWPVTDAKAGVVIVHGLAEHSGRYAHVAQALNKAGYTVYAADLRGHGRSAGFPGDMGGDLQTLINDVISFCARAAGAHTKTFLLAHSMGTLLALPAVAEMPAGTVDGLILSGVALMPGPAVLEAIGSGEGIPPELISRDPEVVEAYKKDELVFYDRVPQELMAMAMEATQRASAAVPQINVPTLILHGADDQICDISGADYVFVELVVVDKQIQRCHGLYHEVLNEPEKDKVIGDVVTWLDAHVD